ncbi:MAG: filamentous hemagglutinin N-terminal domain-containing protein, partial [Comamonas sp.]|uniref:two-partner secretion domain-containing protein n=1 Tax=Comamonas sp. TaxID=34028 RepID=UPI002FC715AF
MKSNKAFRLRFLSLVVAAMCAGGARAQLAPGALPTGATVIGGQASIVQNGTTLNIHQTSAQALVNFSSFNIGSAALVDIRQPGAAAALLARVTGGDPSQIYGQITANGALWLVNPAGIMVGQGARIDVGAFIASTLNVSDSDFLAGRLNFTSAGNAAGVRNAGTVNAGAAAGGGRIYLVGQTVENAGSLNAPNGEVLLAAGQNVQLLDTGHPGVSIALSGAGGNARNLGRIVAEAGRIGLGGALVANAGEISASSAHSVGGRVFLRANEVTTSAASHIHADGLSGGSVVLVGDTADIDGRISATGSAGPGGFVDTSGHARLNVKNAPTVGKGGEWLIDPSNLQVVAGAGGDANVQEGIIVSTEAGTTIGADVITAQLNVGAHVVLATGGSGTGEGNITVNAAIAKTGGENAQLTLRAHNDIEINAPITSSAGSLGLSLKNNFHGSTTTPGHAATINADINLNGGALEVSQGEALGNGTLNIASGTTTLQGASRILAAAVNVRKDGRVSIDSAQTLQGVWTNAGEIELQGEGALNLENADASLLNTGRLTLSGTNSAVLAGASEASNLTNNGEIVKTSSGAQDISRLTNGGAGSIVIEAGQLSLSRTTVGGAVKVAQNAELAIKGAEQGEQGSELAGGVNITGAGAMTWRGNVRLLGDVTLGANAPTLTIEPSVLTFVGGTNTQLTTHNLIDIRGELVLDGDTVWNNHGPISVGADQPGVLSFNTNAILNNKASGVVDVKDNSRLMLSTLTTINNEAGALLQIASTETNTFSGGYQGRINNSGTIEKTGLGTTPAPIVNQAGGLLDIRAGVLGVTFSSTDTNQGTIRIAEGATLRSYGPQDLYNAGTIRGTGTVDFYAAGPTLVNAFPEALQLVNAVVATPKLVNNGIVAPGGSDEVGTLTVNGGYAQGAQGALNIRLSGDTADKLQVTGPVQLAGALNLSTLGGGLPVDGVQASVLTGDAGRTGSFTVVNAPAIITPELTGRLAVDYPVSETALVQV